MKWAAAATAAAALLAGGCHDIGPSGEVIGNAPAGPTECKDATSVELHLTHVLTLKSSANEIDQNDPHRSWIPVVRGRCVTAETAAVYPIGSRYMP